LIIFSFVYKFNFLSVKIRYNLLKFAFGIVYNSRSSRIKQILADNKNTDDIDNSNRLVLKKLFSLN